MRRIGIIGAGIMAAGMAQNFLKHGYSVTMWNRTPEHLELLLKAGAEKAETPKAVCEATDFVIECVTNDEASRSVWLGESGILAGANHDKILAASSSLSLEWTDELAKMCREQGIQFMDMPLTGSRSGAENGTLRLLIGAEEPVFNAAHDDLEAIAEKIYRFGQPGSGMRFKLLLNSLIAIHMNAAGQAQLLAERVGIDPRLFAHALIDGNMGPASPASKLVFDSASWEEGHVNFALQWMEKDLRYAREMARSYDFDFDLLNDTQVDYTKAKDAGLGASDVTAIAKLFRS